MFPHLLYSSGGGARQVLDSNNDGSVSPSELHNFLCYFGPLEHCVQRTVNSLLEFRSDEGARALPWFVFTKLDRATVNRVLPPQVCTRHSPLPSVPGSGVSPPCVCL